MRVAYGVLLLAATADAGTSHRTTIVSKPEGNDAVEAALVKSLSSKDGTKLDACLSHEGAHTVNVELAAGRVKKVEHVDGLEKSEEACLVRVLKAQKVSAARSRVTVTLELTTAVRDGTTGQGTSRATNAAPTAGELSPEQINRVIRARVGLLRDCYVKEQEKTPALAGKVTMSFKISADGSVASAKVTSSTLKSAAVESCLVTQIKRLKFPTSEKGANVNYPFLFGSGI